MHYENIVPSVALKLLNKFDLVVEEQEILYQNKKISDRIALKPYNLIHEVAHFQVASCSRRYIRNFGLGATAYEKINNLLYTPELSDDDIIIEECRATLLTFFWYKFLGIDSNWEFYDEPIMARTSTKQGYTIPIHHIPKEIDGNIFHYKNVIGKEYSYKKGIEIPTLEALNWLLDKKLLNDKQEPTYEINNQ